VVVFVVLAAVGLAAPSRYRDVNGNQPDHRAQVVWIAEPALGRAAAAVSWLGNITEP